MTTWCDLVVLEFVPVRRETLRGFCRVQLTGGMILTSVSVHQDERRWWAMPGSTVMVDRAGIGMRDADGKLRHVAQIEWVDREHKHRFSGAVIAALRRAFPEALEVQRVAS